MYTRVGTRAMIAAATMLSLAARALFSFSFAVIDAKAASVVLAAR
jgi:hypothetical protein